MKFGGAAESDSPLLVILKTLGTDLIQGFGHTLIVLISSIDCIR
jgi:hypothetical protein